MTIIEPNKNRQRVNTLFWGSIGLLVAVALWSISVYNQTVNLNHDLRAAESREGELQTANAELKNKRYALSGTKQLLSVAVENGLVKVTHPDYLEASSGAPLANR